MLSASSCLLLTCTWMWRWWFYLCLPTRYKDIWVKYTTTCSLFQNNSFKASKDEADLPPRSILDGFPGLHFAPEAVPSPSPKSSLLHAEQHPARLDHHHQGQKLGAQHLTCLKNKTWTGVSRKAAPSFLCTASSVRSLTACDIMTFIPDQKQKTQRKFWKKVNEATCCCTQEPTLKDSRAQSRDALISTRMDVTPRVWSCDTVFVPSFVWKTAPLCFPEIRSTRNCTEVLTSGRCLERGVGVTKRSSDTNTSGPNINDDTNIRNLLDELRWLGSAKLNCKVWNSFTKYKTNSQFRKHISNLDSF